MGRDKAKAVFLDRDGVINRETGDFIFEPEKFILNEDIFGALKKFIENGYILVIITNQSGIARGRYTHEHVETLHGILKKKMAGHGVGFAEIYYCPHHPIAGKCLCRKPDSLLLEKAIARFNIDPSASWMIGDRERDIEAGKRAGVKGVLINSNESLMKYMNTIFPQQ